MTKISTKDFFDKFRYYKFKCGMHQNKRGYYYWLCDQLTFEDIEYLSQFDNVALFKSRCEYAPEIVSDVVFIRGYK